MLHTRELEDDQHGLDNGDGFINNIHTYIY